MTQKKPRAIETAVAVREEAPITAHEARGEALIAQAIEKGVDVGTMERLLVMRRELKAEAAKEAFDTAMAKFQAECPTIVKTKEVKTRGGVVAYRYAPIESIVEQVRDALQRNGFSYKTNQELLPAGVKITIRVIHAQGHSEETSMEVPFGSKTDIMSQSQVAAAASTFAKRYAFCNAFGILTGDEDTDARPQAVEAEAQSPQSVAEAKFQTALTMVKGGKSIDSLLTYGENLKDSKLFSKEQKDELGKALNKRIGELERANGEG